MKVEMYSSLRSALALLWILRVECMCFLLGELWKSILALLGFRICSVPPLELEEKNWADWVFGDIFLFVLPALWESWLLHLQKHVRLHRQPQLGCFKAPPLTEKVVSLLSMCLIIKQDILGPVINAFVEHNNAIWLVFFKGIWQWNTVHIRVKINHS